MKAYMLHGIGDLRYEERPLPELRPGWALVRVLAAGICSSDIPRIFEKGTYHFPTIPGHEFSGLVEAAADGSGRQWIGRRVGIFPLIPCKNCPSCRKGQYETCSNYDYIGSRRDGAFAEFTAVPVWNLIALPETVSDIQGALLEPAAVALHAVKRAEVSPGDDVCVVGTGAIGLLAGQWAKIFGAGRVVIKGRGEAKRQIVQRCGLEYAADSRIGEEFGRVIEAVGSAQALEESLSLTAPGGKLVLMGNPDGPRTLSQDLYWRILRKQLTLTGTWNSSYGGENSDWAAAVQAMGEGTLQTEAVVSHVLEREALAARLAVMRGHTEAFCKVVVKF
ncbi:galactitol-1-phosphate 5-dehydrogenase [Oscillospiraceae bacterium 50-60]